MACQQEYFLAKQFSATKATCHLSSQPKARFRVKSQKCYSSLLLLTFTIQARVYYSWLLFKIPFCLFKEVRSSFVSTFNLGSYALPSLFFLSLPSLFFLSHHVTPSSFQAFKLSSSFPTFVHCKIFLLMYNISMF